MNPSDDQIMVDVLERNAVWTRGEEEQRRCWEKDAEVGASRKEENQSGGGEEGHDGVRMERTGLDGGEGFTVETPEAAKRETSDTDLTNESGTSIYTA